MSEHLGDGLSALLDGELTPAEEATALSHLAACPSCRRELDGTAAARAAVRALPRLPAPAGLLTPAPPRWRHALATAVAAAAAWLVVAGVGAETTGRTAPPLTAFLASHEAAAASAGAPLAATLSPAVTAGATSSTITPVAVPDPWTAAADLVPGWPLVAAVRRGDAVQLIYSDGKADVSVFEQRGDLDWSALPAGGRRVRAGDREVWEADAGIHRVAVYQEDGVIVTVVANGPSGMATEASTHVPDPGSGSWLDRARRACQGLVDTFSFRS